MQSFQQIWQIYICFRHIKINNYIQPYKLISTEFYWVWKRLRYSHRLFESRIWRKKFEILNVVDFIILPTTRMGTKAPKVHFFINSQVDPAAKNVNICSTHLLLSLEPLFKQNKVIWMFTDLFYCSNFTVFLIP